ncbi:MAG: hypothetical protein HY236_14805 [Acidobacteria bacterium]|nr:hypothetical protein [Acidobacteriota bacterium]
MRFRVMVLSLALMLAVPGLLVAQQKEAPEQMAPDTRAADLQVELSKITFTAKRNIPSSDGIIVENGRVMEELFGWLVREYPAAIRARQTAAVSKVVFLDRAVQVFFADGKCALMILAKEDRLATDMKGPELLQLVRQGIDALFVSKPPLEQNKKPRPVT